ncbi:MAG: DNA methylase [Ignavibacteria bacterium RIFOXYB2_FULL_35_12]|nr:MAG: DNA methylase [Ignavibacteria bacterium GWC2_35_8]OGU60995.1 MAG: DNA methylase [Ignavibacteria bacterium GWF2_35_20]OGU83481.1 MAG: DNA methylase [Ignavibacteria bacterium RIFOXYA2_FULL_35_9]OGU84953.1 MAG: DNA methylase [Ignavibacteria bacterium RIFOXYA12_FULL_35_25]OGU92580.1 MAG: DNA methylase [Ignavibacteria bacterium RIFOXYC12_FULL_35_11]OGU95750.1 MAG: DNA methylase [Ignavibacteria bacterium RIFOXYB12_FULL_35_14]OGU99226.1 MAG: DNA methylase [Ignavibacteria bacterium RIFOXYC2_F
MTNFPLPRLDKDPELNKLLLPYCRLKFGEMWTDEQKLHRVACIDACDISAVQKMLGEEKAVLAIQDPPYNFVAFEEHKVERFISWCELWIENTFNALYENSSLYIWLGADQNDNFQPFPQFILMMADSGFNSKSFLTMRNQRGYGTQKNWMAIRQELLFYVKGNPDFYIDAEYTDIPKVLKGYYKKVNGKVTENFERSKSENIRAGNVWIDIQQVFYRMEENVNGCFAQKPLKAIERIIQASSQKGELVMDLFSHSGSTLLAAEKLNRRAFVSDIDPIFCEISIRRLERYRNKGKTGWQNSNPFANEILKDKELKNYLVDKYDIKIPNRIYADNEELIF